VTHAARTAHVDQKGGTGRTGRARVPRARVGRGSAVSGGVPSGGENGREHGGNAWGRPLPDCLNGTPPARLTTFCLLHTSRRPSAVFYWSRTRGYFLETVRHTFARVGVRLVSGPGAGRQSRARLVFGLFGTPFARARVTHVRGSPPAALEWACRQVESDISISARLRA
jgi:hypothetical protein